MPSNFKIERMGLANIINLALANRYNKSQLGKLLGVTPLQIHYYGNGKTKNPSPIIVMKLLTKVEILGSHYLADIYEDFADLENHYSIVTRKDNESNT